MWKSKVRQHQALTKTRDKTKTPHPASGFQTRFASLLINVGWPLGPKFVRKEQMERFSLIV